MIGPRIKVRTLPRQQMLLGESSEFTNRGYKQLRIMIVLYYKHMDIKLIKIETDWLTREREYFTKLVLHLHC